MAENTPKSKAESVKIKLIGAGSCSIEGKTYRKGEEYDIPASETERYKATGLFEML